MPDFIVAPFLKSQEAEGVTPTLLVRHEIESYLLEPSLFERAAKLVGREITSERAKEVILSAGETMKAKAHRTCLETAKRINRFLDAERMKDPDLEEKVYKWFHELDLKSLSVIQDVFPGREVLQESLKIINDGASKNLTRGHLVACVARECMATSICGLLESFSEAKTEAG